MKRMMYSALLGFLIHAAPATADLTATFDSDQEDWQTSGDAYPANWKPEDGNPGGYIEGIYMSDGRTWYFVSPESWAGDWRIYRNLSFDLRQTGSGGGFVEQDLIVIGKTGNQLTWKGEREPSASWTSYTLSLDPATFKTTQAKYDTVMKNVAQIMIRGEFIGGSDTGGLDNVSLSETPANIHGTIQGFGRYSLVCKNNTTRQTVTLSGSVKLDWNCEAMGLVVRDGDSILISLKGNAAK